MSMADPAAHDISPAAQKHLRRNTIFGILNGVFYRISETMMDSTLVIPWFLSQLTDSTFIIGLVSPIRTGGWYLPQLLTSGYVQRQEKKLGIYRAVGLLRGLAIAGLAASVWTLSAHRGLMLGLFFLFLTLMSIGEGLSGIAFLDIVAKAIPGRRRGAFFATRNFLGGILALGSSAAVRLILDESSRLTFPISFAILFTAAGLGMWGSIAAFSSLTEPIEPADPTVVPLRDQLRRAMGHVRADRNYRRLIITRLLMLYGYGFGAPFYILYAKEALNATASSVGVFLLSYTISSIAANLVWGRLSAKFGNRLVIVLSTLVGVLLPISALLAGRAGSLELFYIPFILRGVYEASIMVGPVNFVLDIAPAKERPTYIGLINTTLGVASLSLLTSGWVAELVGFETLFLLTIVFYLGSFIAARGLVAPDAQVLAEASGSAGAS
jgi:hypothetical protein